ncbi:hypothetical protein [Prochlorococcus sp. MIT 0701]|uniref:hypothetical protein n=1 Tax=Prochlorococcus sp. MIT 0701 TaxID=1499502 RepID=UPI001267A430|nr:hypothetical protein [Prochlorococcus sp. MIT 0701]
MQATNKSWQQTLSYTKQLLNKFSHAKNTAKADSGRTINNEANNDASISNKFASLNIRANKLLISHQTNSIIEAISSNQNQHLSSTNKAKKQSH